MGIDAVVIRASALIAALLLVAGQTTGQATEQDAARDRYVTANLLSIFYHEFGHALIDVMALPVFGQEEDAADTASVILIDTLFDEDSAQSIVRNAAFGFLDEAAQLAGQDPPWWDEHGPDQQRYYNLVCLFYGADTEKRAELSDELGLPEDRAAGCAQEFDLAIDSWGPVLDELANGSSGETLAISGDTRSKVGTLIFEEVADLNAEIMLPVQVSVVIEPCAEANAFYSPEDRQITMCTEMTAHLIDLFDQQQP